MGQGIVQGLQEGIAYARGETELRERVIQVRDAVNVRNIRERTGLSQTQFADRFGFSLRTLQEWEQGRAQPDLAIRAYLTVIARNPTAVEEALREAS